MGQVVLDGPSRFPAPVDFPVDSPYDDRDSRAHRSGLTRLILSDPFDAFFGEATAFSRGCEPAELASPFTQSPERGDTNLRQAETITFP